MSVTPPPFVEAIKYHELKQINQQGKRVYQTPSGTTPSVTTILSKTKDMTGLKEWRNRVGEVEAQRIMTEAAGVGTALHNNLERFLAGDVRQPGNNLVHVQANKMADVIIENGLSGVDEVWAIEQGLYYPEMYSGTTDLCGVYKGKPAIMDFKQARRLKKKEWVLYRMNNQFERLHFILDEMYVSLILYKCPKRIKLHVYYCYNRPALRMYCSCCRHGYRRNK